MDKNNIGASYFIILIFISNGPFEVMVHRWTPTFYFLVKQYCKIKTDEG